uniref:Uncharacterized protein n=1 Tax=Rhizophora mucronata TaxID=61149 RepID=A0A2P2IWT9_RHIMU
MNYKREETDKFIPFFLPLNLLRTYFHGNKRKVYPGRQ